MSRFRTAAQGAGGFSASLAGVVERNRWMLAILDQGAIAATNLGLTILFSQASGLSGLGAYALLSVTMLAVLGLVRTLMLDPWLASKTKDSDRLGPQVRALAWSSAALSMLPTALLAVFVGHGISVWMWAAVPAALMIVQDTGRYSAYASAQPGKSLASDALLLITLSFGAVLGWASNNLGVGWVLCAWIVAYLVSLIPLRHVILGPVRLRGAKKWWGENCRSLALPLLQDSMAYIVTVNGSMYLLAALASKEALGAIRIVTSLFSPMSLIFAGLSMWLVPAFAKSRGVSEVRSMRYMPYLLGFGVTSWCAILAILGPWLPWLVSMMFGVELSGFVALVLAGGVMTLLGGLGTVWLAGVKVHGRYQAVSWTRSLSAILVIAAVGLVAWAQTPSGYLSVLAFQNGLIAAVAGYSYWVLTSSSLEGRAARGMANRSFFRQVEGPR